MVILNLFVFCRVYRIRPGASSGILLGAVTLPGLAVSKLIQLRRGLLVNEVTIEGTLLKNQFLFLLVRIGNHTRSI